MWREARRRFSPRKHLLNGIFSDRIIIMLMWILQNILNGNGGTWCLENAMAICIWSGIQLVVTSTLNWTTSAFLAQTDKMTQWTWFWYRKFRVIRNMRARYNFNQRLVWDFDGKFWASNTTQRTHAVQEFLGCWWRRNIRWKKPRMPICARPADGFTRGKQTIFYVESDRERNWVLNYTANGLKDLNNTPQRRCRVVIDLSSG